MPRSACGSSTRRTAAPRSRSSTRRPRPPRNASNPSCARSSARSAGWRRRNGRPCRSSSGASTMSACMRQVPAITELVQIDRQGREQLKVSRLTMDVVGSGTDLSKEPAFVGAMANRVWFGPVYFRKESEPYLTMAVAAWRARRRHRGRDQPQADLGRRLADQGRQGRLRLCRRPAGPAGGASRHLAGAARHRHEAPAAGGGGARRARGQQQRDRRHEPRRRLGALRPCRDPGAEMAGLRRGADHRGAAARHQCRPARACRCWCWAC